MSLRRTVLLSGLLISLANAAHGDITPGRGPLPKPPMVAPVKIVEEKVDDLDPNVVAKIVIPSSLLPDLQASSQASQASMELHIVGMTLAGFALTAIAICLMGADKKGPNWKKGVVILIGCFLLVAIVLLMNFFFPPKIIAPSADPKPQPQIVIEVQNGGHEVILVLPRGE